MRSGVVQVEVEVLETRLAHLEEESGAEVLGTCLTHLEESGAEKVEEEVLGTCLAHLVEESETRKVEVEVLVPTRLAHLVEENARDHLDNRESGCPRLNLSDTCKSLME